MLPGQSVTGGVKDSVPPSSGGQEVGEQGSSRVFCSEGFLWPVGGHLLPVSLQGRTRRSQPRLPGLTGALIPS